MLSIKTPKPSSLITYQDMIRRPIVATFSSQGRYQRKGHDLAIREIYDGQTDELLAVTSDDNNEKLGMVFDQNRKMANDKNQGYDDADAYMNVIMTNH